MRITVELEIEVDKDDFREYCKDNDIEIGVAGENHPESTEQALVDFIKETIAYEFNADGFGEVVNCWRKS